MLLRELKKYPNPPVFLNTEYLKLRLLSECNRNFSIYPTVKDLIQQLVHLNTHLPDCALNKTKSKKQDCIHLLETNLPEAKLFLHAFEKQMATAMIQSI